MSKDVIRLTIPDVSAFTKSLRAAFGPAVQDKKLSHVACLNHVAKAAGYRNFQHLRRLNTPEPDVDAKRIDRAARYFDAQGRWARWPMKRGVRETCLWVIWARLPARTHWTEREISALIDEETVFRDAAQIRRSLVEMRLLMRNLDGSDYLRVEGPMEPHGQALVRRLAEQRMAIARA